MEKDFLHFPEVEGSKTAGELEEGVYGGSQRAGDGRVGGRDLQGKAIPETQGCFSPQE